MVRIRLPSGKISIGYEVIAVQSSFCSYTGDIKIDYYETPGWRMEEFHFHDHWEIKICRSCDMTVVSDGESAECHGSCVVIYRPFALHWANSTSNGAFERYNINFFEEYIERYLDDDIRPQTMFHPDTIVIPLNREKVEKIYSYCHFLEEEKSDEEKRKLLLTIILREIKSAILEKNESANQNARIDSGRFGYVYGAMKYINENIGCKSIVETTAKMFFVSCAKLRSDFKILTKETLGDYIDCVRLIKAKRLLSNGESVLSVAEKCGYSNRNSFIRFFKQQTGVTPSKYSFKMPSDEAYSSVQKSQGHKE